jgi:hypothetical protein
MVGVDGTSGSRRALEWTAKLALAADLGLLTVHVLTYSREFARDLSLDTMRNWRRELRCSLETEWTTPLTT